MGTIEVIVTEGPAGSGKTTALQTLMTIFPEAFPFVPDLSKPRNYGGYQLSMKRNFHQLLYLLTSTEKMILLDRFWVSTFAYELIRNVSVENFSGWMEELFLQQDVLQEQIQHLDPLYSIPRLSITYLFCLPDLATLERQRADAAREFPFDAGVELGIYNGLFFQMQALIDTTALKGVMEWTEFKSKHLRTSP